MYKNKKYKKALVKYKEARTECLNMLLVIIPYPKYTYKIDDYINEMNTKIDECLHPPLKYSVLTSSSSSLSKLPLLRKSTSQSKSRMSNTSTGSMLLEDFQPIQDEDNNNSNTNELNLSNDSNNSDNSDTYILPSLTTVAGVFYSGKKLIRKANYFESKCRFHDAAICLKESVKVMKPLLVRELKKHEKEPLCDYICQSELKLSMLTYYPPVESQKDMLSKIQLYITHGDLLLSLIDPIKSYMNYKVALNIVNGLDDYVIESEDKCLECVLEDDIDLKRKDVNTKLEEIEIINELIVHERNADNNRINDRDEAIREYMKARELCIKLEEYRIYFCINFYCLNRSSSIR